MGRPTIIDVAKAAGVSKSTVSLVLQNSAAVSAKTREDVRRAMAELGYVYNRAGIPAMQVLRKVSPRADLFPFASPDDAAGGASRPST